MESNHDSSQTKKAAVGGLAVVGFIALILIGIATAIYAASFLPKAIGKLSSANVYLSGLVQPNDNNNTLQAVQPTTPFVDSPAPTSIPLSPATSTSSLLPTEQPTTVPTYTPPATQPTKPVYTAPATPTYTRVQVPSTPNYYGLADLVTTITGVGYLRTNGDTNSFIAASTVPSGYQGAVRFVIANRGTNVSPSWDFRASLPGAGNSSDYRSDSQRSLKPGDSIVFTMGFDSTTRGSDTVRIEADSSDRISESNESNNVATQTIYLNGNSNTNSNSNRDYDSNGTYCRYGTYYQNGRYYCETSSSNRNNDEYDSNGNYCRYGTYYQNGRYYCESSSSNNDRDYDSNGNFCPDGAYYSYSNNRYYCY